MIIKEKKNKKNKKVNKNYGLIVDFVTEEYRFLKSYKYLTSKLGSDDVKRCISIYNFHYNKIQELMSTVNLKIVELEGKPYDEGLSVIALNIEDFSPDDTLIIDQVMEPLIISEKDGMVIKSGTIIVTKLDRGEEKCL